MREGGEAAAEGCKPFVVALVGNAFGLAREHGRVTVGDAMRATGSGRDTLERHFRALVKSDRLQRHGGGRGTWYSLS